MRERDWVAGNLGLPDYIQPPQPVQGYGSRPKVAYFRFWAKNSRISSSLSGASTPLTTSALG